MDYVERLNRLFTNAVSKGCIDMFIVDWLLSKDKQVIQEIKEEQDAVTLTVEGRSKSLYNLLIDSELLKYLYPQDSYLDYNWIDIYIMLEFDDPNCIEVLLDLCEHQFSYQAA